MCSSLSLTFLLNRGDIGQMVDLQASVLDNLSNTGKGNIVIRDRDAYKDHLLAGMIIIGLKNRDGELKGMCLMSDERRSGLQQDFLLQSTDALRTIAIEGVLVNPNAQGCGVGTNLLNLAQMVAWIRGYSKLVAKIREGNHCSLSTFHKVGYTIYDTARDGRGKANFLERDYLWTQSVLHRQIGVCTLAA